MVERLEADDELYRHREDQRSVEAVEANPELADARANLPPFVNPWESMLIVEPVEEDNG